MLKYKHEEVFFNCWTTAGLLVVMLSDDQINHLLNCIRGGDSLESKDMSKWMKPASKALIVKRYKAFMSNKLMEGWELSKEDFSSASGLHHYAEWTIIRIEEQLSRKDLKGTWQTLGDSRKALAKDFIDTINNNYEHPKEGDVFQASPNSKITESHRKKQWNEFKLKPPEGYQPTGDSTQGTGDSTQGITNIRRSKKMAIGKSTSECIDCGGTVSGRAGTCPHCGADFSIPRGRSDRILQLFGWVGGATLLALFWDAAADMDAYYVTRFIWIDAYKAMGWWNILFFFCVYCFIDQDNLIG